MQLIFLFARPLLYNPWVELILEYLISGKGTKSLYTSAIVGWTIVGHLGLSRTTTLTGLTSLFPNGSPLLLATQLQLLFIFLGNLNFIEANNYKSKGAFPLTNNVKQSREAFRTCQNLPWALNPAIHTLL